MATIVCFRKFVTMFVSPSGTPEKREEVIAIFPQQEGTHPGVCGSYQRVGQHGECAPYGLILDRTKPATPEDYADLLSELKSIGYDDLRVVKRISGSHYWWRK